MNTASDHLAARLRVVKKLRGLSGRELAAEVDRRTDGRLSVDNDMWLSRRLSGRLPMLKIAPELIEIAEALELDPRELVIAAFDAAMEDYRSTVPAS